MQKYGALPQSLNWGALYDLRLRLSIDHPVVRIPEPLSTRDVEDQRTADQPMDQQPVCGRIDVRDAIVRSFEMQAVRGDRALQSVQRRARDTRAGSTRQTRYNSRDLAIEVRRLAIRRR